MKIWRKLSKNSIIQSISGWQFGKEITVSLKNLFVPSLSREPFPKVQDAHRGRKFIQLQLASAHELKNPSKNYPFQTFHHTPQNCLCLL